MNKIQEAEKLAKFIHTGQKRRSGEDYVEHPKRVAVSIKNLGYDEDVIIAALLHDTEDYENFVEMIQIIREKFGDTVYHLVVLMTHVSEIPYNNYIYDIATMSEEAMAIKWQDIIDNTNDVIPEKQFNKYRNALIFLNEKGIDIPKLLKKRFKLT